MTERGLERRSGATDLVVATGISLGAALAVAYAPAGATVRLALVLPVLLFVPGYLLIQALVVPPPPLRTRLVHSVLAVGISPALVGLLALATAVVPGGFQPTPIVATVTVACLCLAFVAFRRRLSRNVLHVGRPVPPPAGAPVPEPSSLRGLDEKR